jgi:hypothetical protein
MRAVQAPEGTWHGEERCGGSWGSGNGRRRRRSGTERNREREGLEVEDRDLCAVSQKCRDSTVKPNLLSKHSSNENVPKCKSVELRKIYNFALRFSFKRVKHLNLFENLSKF